MKDSNQVKRNGINFKIKGMKTKRILGIILAIVSFFFGSYIIVKQSSLTVYLQSIGATMLIVGVVVLIVYLIADDN